MPFPHPGVKIGTVEFNDQGSPTMNSHSLTNGGEGKKYSLSIHATVTGLSVLKDHMTGSSLKQFL